jgi:Tol biopolymer transport system component
VRRPLLAIAAIVFVIGLLARDDEGKGWDCGTGGVPPHPEIGGELVFNCSTPATSTGLYLLDVATGKVRPLIVDHAWNTDPAWSPDGKRVAYVSTRDGETDIYVLELASGAVTRLTRDGSWNGNPTWSPDGAWIMFDSSRLGTNPSKNQYYRNLFAVRPDGSQLTQVTGLGGYNGTPSWSPDGTRVAFASDRGGYFHLYTMAPNGTDQSTLTTAPGGYARWSHDGSRVLFAGPDARDTGEDPTNFVYVTDVAQPAPRRITSGNDIRPDWSPGERWISFARSIGERHELFVVRVDGGDVVRLTWDGSDKDWARWRPR